MKITNLEKVFEGVKGRIELLVKEFNNNFSCLEITKLKKEMVRQASIYGKHLRLEARAVDCFATLDYVETKFRAEQYLWVEKKLKKDSEERITEKRINSEIDSSEFLNDLELARIKLKAVYGQIVAIRKALEHKKDMMIQLATMRKEEIKHEL